MEFIVLNRHHRYLGTLQQSHESPMVTATRHVSKSSSIPSPQGLLGHHWSFHNQFPPFFPVLHCPLDLANSRPVSSLTLSSHLISYLSCFLPPFTVPCKMVLARLDERPYHCSLHLFTMVRRSLCGRIACLILARTSSFVTFSLSLMKCVVSCGSTSFPWLVFFFGALLWGSMIHKHAGRWMWQGSASVVSWNQEKYSCHSKLVSTLSMLLLSE